MSTRHSTFVENLEGRRLLAAAVSASNAALTAVGDVTQDHRADAVSVEPVATGTAGRFRVTTAVGDGRGGFHQRSVHELSITRPIAMVNGDLANQGSGGSVLVSPQTSATGSPLIANIMFPFQGNTYFFQSTLHASNGLGATDGSWAMGRIDGDGLNDLVRLDQSGMINVFRNSGCFTFDSGGTQSFVFFGGNAKQLSLGDFDNDGNTDMAAITNFGVQVAPAIGGNPCAPAITIDPGVSNTPKTLTSTDANGDGRDDLIIGLTNGGVLTMLQQPSGTFASPARSLSTIDATATRMQTSDVDGDGDIDLIVTAAPAGASTLSVARNNGNGFFTPASFGTKKTELLFSHENGGDPTAVI